MEQSSELSPDQELTQRAAEVKRKAFEAELRHIDDDTDRRGRELLRVHLAEMEREHNRYSREHQDERRKEEQALKHREQEFRRRLDRERQLKIEARRKAEAERKHQEELARKQAQDEERRRREEASLRRKADADRRRKEDSRRRKEDKERKKAEADSKRRELVMKLRDDEARVKEERRERLTELFENARTLFADREYKSASEEIAKALEIDPGHAGASDLARRIREALEPGSIAAEAAQKESKKNRRPPLQKLLSRYKVPAAVLLPVLAALIIGTIYLVSRWNTGGSGPSVSIAVLPWTAPAPGSDEAVYGCGLAGQVAERFSSVRMASVLGFPTAANFARTGRDPRQEAFNLGYRYVLEGNVARSGEILEVTLDLMDAQGNVVWSKPYKRDIAGIAALPGDVASNVLSFLRHESEREGQLPASHSNSVTPEAYLCYLRGNVSLLDDTRESLTGALGWFRQATGSERAFAEAQAATALVLMLQRDGGGDQSDSTLTEAARLAQRSIQMNSSIADGYIAMGAVLIQQHEYTAAIDQLDTALDREPGSALARYFKGNALLRLGNFSAAIAELADASALDPRNAGIQRTLALAWQLKGKARQSLAFHEEALKLSSDSVSYLLGPYADAIELDPGSVLQYSSRVGEASKHRIEQHPADYVTIYRYSRLLQITGNRTESTSRLEGLVSQIRWLLEENPDDAQATMVLALTLTRLGRFTEALTVAQSALKLSGKTPEIHYALAKLHSLQMYSQRDNKIDEKSKQQSIDALREAISLGFRPAELADADFYNLYQQPEFAAAIRDVSR